MSDERPIPEAAIAAGVAALARECPLDVAFPLGNEADAVREVLRAAMGTGSIFISPIAVTGEVTWDQDKAEYALRQHTTSS